MWRVWAEGQKDGRDVTASEKAKQSFCGGRQEKLLCVEGGERRRGGFEDEN
jgi:hypothetical protein